MHKSDCTFALSGGNWMIEARRLSEKSGSPFLLRVHYWTRRRSRGVWQSGVVLAWVLDCLVRAQ